MGKTGTRAGYVGDMSDAQLQAAYASGGGFGVFAYYTNGSGYNSASSAPNFMWNQKVTYNAGPWTYSPVKYWPNETANGVVDQNSASSTGGADKLSFFAYAPFADKVTLGTTDYTLDPATGLFQDTSSNDYYGQSGATGITKYTSNATNGDPKVYFSLPADPKNTNTVDLLWGVAPSSASYTIAQSSTVQSITEGMPNIDLTKQTVTENIEFLFKHALAKVTFTVEGVFDEVSAGSNAGDSNTKIVVESVSIPTTFPQKGILNLNNTIAGVPLWTADGAGTATIDVANSDLLAGIKYDGTTDTYGGQPTGVTTSPQALLADSKYYMLIPTTANLPITITYHVFTNDANLAGGFSKVTNVITKTISSLALEGGKAYTINLQLGMTTVKFNATVGAWGTGSTTTVDLPINVAP